jgi:signal transduction histidine kinase
MIETSKPEPIAAWLAMRLQTSSRALAERWLDRLNALLIDERQEIFPSDDLLDHIPELLRQIAEHLRLPASSAIEANTLVMRKAAELGELRFTQRASVHQLLREYQLLADVVHDFLGEQIREPDVPGDMSSLLETVRRVTRSVAVLQQQTIDAFVARYTETIERQTSQLRSFERLVSHEIRQPLGVLQVIAHALPVSDGDVEATRMVDMLHRNVDRLTEVTANLERLARLTRVTDVMPREQRVDLSAVVADVAHQLADMADARGVQVRVEENLPELFVDAARTELVFVNLLANAIKYSDPTKRRRVVQVTAKPGASQPTIVVQDNGIGIPADQLQHIFREFVRAHALRDDELGAQGFGIGLSIVRECMDAMGGTVRVQSSEGDGTVFTLTWPAPAAVRLR